MRRLRVALAIAVVILAGVAAAAHGQTVRTLPLRASALVAEPVSGTLFAAIPADAGITGNSLVAIDPVAGTSGAPVYVGSDPTVLAASADGQFIYVGLSGASAIRRFDVAAGTAGPLYPLARVGTFDEPEFAHRILPVPGSPDTIVVAQGMRHSTWLNLAVYDAGVARPARLAGLYDSVVLVDGSTLVASGPSSVSRIHLDASGLSVISTQSMSVGTLVAAAGGVVFSRDGRAFDAATLSEVRRLGLAMFDYIPARPEPSQGRAYRLINGGATVYNLETFDILHTLPLDVSHGEPRSWIALNGGFAYHTDLPRVVLVGDFTAPAPLPPPPSVLTGRVELLGCVACQPGALFHAAATFTNAAAGPVRVEVKSRIVNTSGPAIDTSPFGGLHGEVDLPPGTRTVTLLQGLVPSGLWGDWRVELTVVEPVSGRTYATSSRQFSTR